MIESAMRPFPLTALAPALSLLLAACAPTQIQTDGLRNHAAHSEAPIASNFPAVAQPRLQAGQHWQVIAQDAAKTIATGLSRGQRCVGSTNPCRPIYVAEPEFSTEFSRGFINALITALVQQGMNVSRAPEAAMVLHLDVQPVRFATNRPQYRHAGQARELGPGVWALQDVSETSPKDLGKNPNPPDTLHWFRTEFSAGATPRTEIMVTVSAMDGIRYAARSTNVYYVTEGDVALYDQEICSVLRPCPTKRAEVMAQPAIPVRKARLAIIGD